MPTERTSRVSAPTLALIGHTCAVLAVAALVYGALPGPGSTPTDDVRMIWFLILYIDFPSSIVSGAIFTLLESQLRGNPYGIGIAVIIPAALFATIGGAQYYWATKWILGYRERRRERQRFSEHRCIECGYDLHGNTSGRCPECGETVL